MPTTRILRQIRWRNHQQGSAQVRVQNLYVQNKKRQQIQAVIFKHRSNLLIQHPIQLADSLTWQTNYLRYLHQVPKSKLLVPRKLRPKKVWMIPPHFLPNRWLSMEQNASLPVISSLDQASYPSIFLSRSRWISFKHRLFLTRDHLPNRLQYPPPRNRFRRTFSSQ